MTDLKPATPITRTSLNMGPVFESNEPQEVVLEKVTKALQTGAFVLIGDHWVNPHRIDWIR